MSAYNATLATSKTCRRCEGTHSIKDFSVDRSKKDGRSIYCFNCVRKINKTRRSKPEVKAKRQKTRRDQIANRAWRLKTRYGMTLQQFDSLFEAQGKCCAICKSDKSDSKNFVVDHSHQTGKIRGILCSYCNRALGMFRDSPELLSKAIKYLREESC